MAYLDEQNFKRMVRTLVRMLWAGQIDIDSFCKRLKAAIEKWYPLAWEEASDMVGGLPISAAVVENIIANDTDYIRGFAEYIKDVSDAGGGLSSTLRRTQHWINGYNKVRNLGMVQAGDETLLQWKRNSRDGCISCLRLEGLVYSASEWEREGLYPQSMRLACMKGAKGTPVCRCEFLVTEKRVESTPLVNVKI